jgi:predicted GNAT family N-acyltransferase
VSLPASILHIQPISAEATYTLRHQILRPNQPIEECIFSFDSAPDTLHVGCFLNGQLVGVGSIFREARDGSPQANGWRIRGMAVRADVRGSGAGGKILQALIAHAASRGLSGEIWCNGRVNVKGYYEHYGFVQQGGIFDLPHTGPHVLMVRTLDTQ